MKKGEVLEFSKRNIDVISGEMCSSLNVEYFEARIREVNDAVQMLRDLRSKGLEELTVHERLSMRYLLIQLVEAASSICTFC